VIVKVFGLTQPIGPVEKEESKKKVTPHDTHHRYWEERLNEGDVVDAWNWFLMLKEKPFNYFSQSITSEYELTCLIFLALLTRSSHLHKKQLYRVSQT
jgi:hypothetical protein